MADETGIPARLYAGIMNTGLLVAFCTVVHFHAIPGISFYSGNVMPPNVSTVTANSVFLIGFEAVGRADLAVAGRAFEFGAVGVGGMGKEDTIRLPCIYQPWDFTFLGHVLVHKDGFSFTFTP